MLELSAARKNKINLSDYDCEQDLQNRMLMADFSHQDLEVLEEILYSPLKVSIKKLARSLQIEEETTLLPILKKLSRAGLLTLEDDSILVDKEKRKYFEFQIARFSPEFKPDMEFIQGILRKVPIHILPNWYSIPRTSNNIFESIVEKYLLTPQIYQRYLMELNFGEPVISSLIQDAFSAPDFKISSSDLIAKYNLARRDFEEILLLLEFNFVCCLTYEKEEDHWIEFVTPFQEWREYLLFLQETEAPIIDSVLILPKRASDFAFIEDMSAILMALKKKPILFPSWQEKLPSSLVHELSQYCQLPTVSPFEFSFAQKYLFQIIEKLCLTKLTDLIDGRLYALETANDWLDMTLENRALFLHRHPLNRILSFSLPAHLSTERNIREAEKSIRRVLHGEWVLFDDFIKGVLVSLNEESIIHLKRTGKHWKYTLPIYGEEEKALIKATIFEWLFEVGIVATGTYEGQDCFRATPFGCSFFED